MTLSDPEKLASFVQSLPGFVIYETIDGNYDHIGATVADAVLQANMRYKTHVKPRVDRILARFPTARTTSSVLQLLKSITATEFLSWRSEDRAERFTKVLYLFSAEDIETEAELREWLTQDANLLPLEAQSERPANTLKLLERRVAQFVAIGAKGGAAKSEEEKSPSGWRLPSRR